MVLSDLVGSFQIYVAGVTKETLRKSYCMFSSNQPTADYGESASRSKLHLTEAQRVIIMFNQERIVQFIRFCAVGGSVAVIDLGTVWIASLFLPALMAVSLGYLIGVTCHFLLNKFWVFRCRSQQYGRQVALYLTQVALCWLMTMLIVSLVLSCTASSVVVARVIAIPPTTLLTFCFMRFVVFRGAGRISFSDPRSLAIQRAEAYTFRNQADPEP